VIEGGTNLPYSFGSLTTRRPESLIRIVTEVSMEQFLNDDWLSVQSLSLYFSAESKTDLHGWENEMNYLMRL
jgi:hypothetical protein